jgi:ATPase subunit of ABC transporter with duplicated ATPase domains
MNNMEIAITGPNSSDKTKLFNPLAEEKEKPKSTIFTRIL